MFIILTLSEWEVYAEILYSGESEDTCILLTRPTLVLVLDFHNVEGLKQRIYQ